MGRNQPKAGYSTRAVQQGARGSSQGDSRVSQGVAAGDWNMSDALVGDALRGMGGITSARLGGTCD